MSLAQSKHATHIDTQKNTHVNTMAAPPVPDPFRELKLARYFFPSSYAGQIYHQNPYPTQTLASSKYGSGHSTDSFGYGYHTFPPPPQPRQQYQSFNHHDYFPLGTHPDVIRIFQMVDRDGSGFIEETELQQALSSGYQRFSIRTIRLLIFLFKNPSDSALKLGPKEFSSLWRCLGQWRAIFEKFDRDQSGKIDATELGDALNGIGYTLPRSVFQVLISRYDEGNSRRMELNFDSFVECGMIVKGLTDKFKGKDPCYTGSATMTYDSFFTMILPFLVSY
ncbi:hypothetical protein ACH5RR_021139 [Cinchona calisaya]|uniref:EF-hand domain-containing protein n=1 Tax=Cinchona calisaya TaxID=153742 RepID=A0ABD2ZJX9_9GENT